MLLKRDRASHLFFKKKNSFYRHTFRLKRNFINKFKKKCYFSKRILKTFFLKKKINKFKSNTLKFGSKEIISKRKRFLFKQLLKTDLIDKSFYFLLKKIFFFFLKNRSLNHKTTRLLKKRFLLYTKKSLMKKKKKLLFQKNLIFFILKNKFLFNSYFYKNFIFRCLKNLINVKKNLFYKKINSKKKKAKISVFYNKIIGMFSKNGLKSKSTRIINRSFFLLHKNLKTPFHLLILRLYNKLKLNVEVKQIKYRRSFHLVPFPINFKRKTFLISKWLLSVIKMNKSKQGTSFKLLTEVSKLLKYKNSSLIKMRKNVVFKSIQNKSNLHFRW